MATTWGEMVEMEKRIAFLERQMGHVQEAWLPEIRNEFAHQVAKHGDETPKNPRINLNEKLNWLVEEVGEVARDINDMANKETLKAELIQVAAIALAWWESLS